MHINCAHTISGTVYCDSVKCTLHAKWRERTTEVDSNPMLLLRCFISPRQPQRTSRTTWQHRYCVVSFRVTQFTTSNMPARVLARDIRLNSIVYFTPFLPLGINLCAQFDFAPFNVYKFSFRHIYWIRNEKQNIFLGKNSNQRDCDALAKFSRKIEKCFENDWERDIGWCNGVANVVTTKASEQHQSTVIHYSMIYSFRIESADRQVKCFSHNILWLHLPWLPFATHRRQLNLVVENAKRVKSIRDKFVMRMSEWRKLEDGDDVSPKRKSDFSFLSAEVTSATSPNSIPIIYYSVDSDVCRLLGGCDAFIKTFFVCIRALEEVILVVYQTLSLSLRVGTSKEINAELALSLQPTCTAISVKYVVLVLIHSNNRASC